MSKSVWTSILASSTKFLLMGSTYFAYAARLRRSVVDVDCPLSNSLFLYVLLLLSLRIVIQSKAHQFEIETYNNESKYICTSMDIRNSLEKFSVLENCEVIEGAVQILLFDNANETELSKINFPLLTEITDYLLLYRVNGLRSIGQLFPNLAVIRGRSKFLGEYSLAIFEMPTLQEIGLYSLTEITKGSVNIDRNPSLCFVHTINWDRIIKQKSDRTFIKSLKPENECPVCPGDDGRNLNGDNKTTALSCPRAPRTSGDSYEKDKFLCWNTNHCQKICPSKCEDSCNDKGQCCHESCLSCSNDDPNLCTVCRNLTMDHGPNKKCISKCPPSYFKFFNRRCVTFDECAKMDNPINILSSDEDVPKSYKVFNNESCLLDCPSNYMSVPDEHVCKPCEGKCQKECEGMNIDSLNAAKQLRGCTHIKGAIEIQIRGGANVVSEFEENLSMIEEISGYLKVVRSFPLISLNFFKSLKRIRGEYLESNKYVFVVLDNQNLQELWDWTNRTLKIDNGKLFFHFNPKLCLDKIRTLQVKAGLPNFTDLEVASNSNGDKVACNVTDLPVKVSQIRNKSVVLQWKQFHMDDQRKLFAYTVYCIEAPTRNVTLYDGRDACGFDNWRVYDVQYQEGEDTVVHILPGLKPYTQYAYFVKTYTVASEPNGAESKIQYFTTLPSRPTQPTNLYISSESYDSLKITWAPPVSPNGNITHYYVTGERNTNGYMFSKDRNYCSDPPTYLPRDESQTAQLATTTPSPANDTCQCEFDGKRIQFTPEEQEARIKFEDELQNEIYQKRVPSLRKKRDTSNEDTTRMRNETENGTNIWKSFNFTVYGKTEIYVNHLHHYSLYQINVEACRAIEGKDDTDPSCGPPVNQRARTQKKPGADNITKVSVSNESLDSVTVVWERPEDPNGVIFTYTVEYQRVDNKHAKMDIRTMCIPSKNTTNKTVVHTITKLLPGNYSLRVSATTAVTNGVFSHYVYFYIEEPSSNTILIVCLILSLFLSVVIFLGWLYKKHLQEKKNMKLIQNVNPEYVPTVYVPDEWEVPRSSIEFIKELGQGSFGMVWEGMARNINGQPEIKCAVKTVNENASARERLEFLNEASVMKAFDTSHVVRLLGVVSEGQPTLVIMELMANGDLKSYLRSHRPDVENFDPNLIRHPPTLKQILQMAIEIADGMAYLSAKKFVHRDLAARNCMVSENLTVKIGDFGMTRDIYETDYYRKGTKGLLPVRWMAPESLKDGVFTSSSDAWSYGVVLWEMATLASQPYQGLSNDQVLRYVIDGGVMERPENCPDKLYTLMRYCWQYKPSVRPTFIKLCQLLLEDANDHFLQVSFYNSPAGIEARAAKNNTSPSHTDDATTPLRKVGEKLRGLMASEQRDMDEINIDTYHQFPNISDNRVLTSATANGYVSGCQTGSESKQPC